MLITYFDEVKYQKGTQPYYWLGGIVASADAIWLLENKVSEFAKECFGVPTLSRETEFHAADIFHRKKNFKSWADISARVNVLNRLITILNEQKDIGKIHVRIEPARMVANDYEQKAFLFFVEKTESFLHAANSPGILIGDRENEKVSGEFAEILSQYRTVGTPYQFGKELKFLIDTVHFTDSHHCRMLQLADLYVWLLQLCTVGDPKKHPQSVVIDHVRKNTDILSHSRYKHWPTADSWIKTTHDG